MGFSASAATERLCQLMAIPGASGEEHLVAEAIRQRLIQAGADHDWIQTDNAHQRSPRNGSVGNLVLKLPGTRRGRRRLFVSHMDTVPICVGAKLKRQGKIIRSADPDRGIGADNRAGVAVTLEAACHLLQTEVPYPPITFLWTIQEEIGLQGARLVSLSRLGRPVCGFNWDGGSAAKLTIGATGGYRFRIEIRGKAAHAGNAPETGVSAIAVAAIAIAQLHQSGWHGLVQQDGHVGTSNVGVIQGGSATNVVADRVIVQAEARSHDPKFRQRIVTEIEQAFHDAGRQVRNAKGATAEVTIEGRLDYESFCLPTDDPCVEQARAAVARAGREPELAVANGGLDANWLSARGIPTVSLGCGQRFQHTVDEELDLAEFHDACRIALDLAHGSNE